ncbi:SIMPL domain-containing protein [Agromyces silvae]|uniref:SIMPL domain-containing protein n=1 Tax=Agromyces silvae TaxID=3388266 RepID=UPI00280B9A8F|nr:SIMPL domain-containing protein [Agromyces protaetiae]
MSTQITVTGRAEARIAPELGAVSIAVAASGPSRDAVLQQAGRAHQALLDEVKSVDAEGVLDVWSAGQLRVWAHRPWNAEGRQLPLAHEARADVEVVFRDLARLTEWVSAAAERDSIAIGGVEWRLTDATRHRVQEDAQRRAVADAIAKARVYADALGLGEPTAVELADRGLLGPQPGPSGPQPVMMRAAAFGGAQAPVTELTPADLVLEASVDARFTA